MTKTIKRGDTVPIPLVARAEQEDGSMAGAPLGDADEIEITFRLEVDGGPDLVIEGSLSGGQIEIVDPAARTGDAQAGKLRFLPGVGDTDDVAAGWKVELKVTWDSRSVPPRVQHFPNERDDNPVLDIDANLEADARP